MSDTRISLDTKTSQSIRKLREASDLSQSALAKKAKVPRARIKRIECNELATIDQKELTRICTVLGMPAKGTGSKKTTTRRASPKRKASASNIKTRTPTRRAIMRLLDEAGVLDMTLRELLN